MRPDISWESFAINNPDARGIHYKFEDLCRQLFYYENISKNKRSKYIHSNPNNPGLEADPIFDEGNNRWIGFQAKFFENTVDFAQIKHSAQMIVEYYSGRVNHVFLFCNKPLMTKSLDETNQILRRADITLELIINDAILDLVRTKYNRLGLYYFGNHSINLEWLKNHAAKMYDELGTRFNKQFNVKTIVSQELSLFTNRKQAIDIFNTEKESIYNTIIKYKCYDDKFDNSMHLKTLKEALGKICCVDPGSNIEEWNQTIGEPIEKYKEAYSREREVLLKELEAMRIAMQNSRQYSQEYNIAIEKYNRSNNVLQLAERLLVLLDDLFVSSREKMLLQKRVMVVFGEAGTGKTQLLANETKELFEDNRAALLLVAGIYYTNDPIQNQIMNNLGFDYSIEDLIDILETAGEQANSIIPIFIDALNETWNNNLWKQGLFSLINKVNHTKNVKLIVSCRPEYKAMLFSDSVLSMIESGEIITIEQTGFSENTLDATRDFLNYYNIPFTPLELFGYQISNPLFLTLYCKTYNGEEVILPELYERLIVHANVSIYKHLEVVMKEKGISENDNLLKPFLDEAVATMYSQGTRHISKEVLCKMTFWSLYGLPPMIFVRQLEKENVLHCYVYNEDEFYFFAYDQMNDYFLAKQIIKSFDDKNALLLFLENDLLEIKNGTIQKEWNIDVFINVCALYAEKYKEECIGIVDTIKCENNKTLILSRYIRSFQWRNPNFISKSIVKQNIQNNKYDLCVLDTLWETLITNSIKETNPLNADFLHEILIPLTLNARDSFWTIYINSFSFFVPNRVVQLITLYDRGKRLDFKNEKQMELLLTLLGWMLTSSNRKLRDYTSKAMIEILKENYHLCLPLLKKFSGVNDPYVIQRLFGIVFGACSKRMEFNVDLFCDLAEYAYNSVFNQENVYPDILLRDYARMIIELFLFENPDYNGVIDHKRISPPYKSEMIPQIEDQHYLDKRNGKGISLIIDSMRLEKMMPYGDFGRYVFQYAISGFDIDLDTIFNYTLYYIFNNLGYSEELFGEHDKHFSVHDRHLKNKTERIGKKYQWIAMYNVLARISDHCKMIDRINYPPKENAIFEGAWNPYVRDFDPTLNKKSMTCSNAPFFHCLKAFICKAKEENRIISASCEEERKSWLDVSSFFHQNLKNNLLLCENDGTEWIALTSFLKADHMKDKELELCVWSWMYAFFVSSEQKRAFVNCANNGLNIITDETASHNQTYYIFNREYPWAPSCKLFREYAWVDVFLDTGRTRMVKKTVPDLTSFVSKGPDCFSILCNPSSASSKTITCKEPVTNNIGKILHATSTLLWEQEYDATIDYTISRSVPCAEIIEILGLRQIQLDGFYYDSNQSLAAFDLNLTQEYDCFVIRKDLLDLFLKKTGLNLIWLVDSAKELYASNAPQMFSSKWQAVFCYEGNRISGELYRQNNETEV